MATAGLKTSIRSLVASATYSRPFASTVIPDGLRNWYGFVPNAPHRPRNVGAPVAGIVNAVIRDWALSLAYRVLPMIATSHRPVNCPLPVPALPTLNLAAPPAAGNAVILFAASATYTKPVTGSTTTPLL